MDSLSVTKESRYETQLTYIVEGQMQHYLREMFLRHGPSGQKQLLIILDLDFHLDVFSAVESKKINIFVMRARAEQTILHPHPHPYFVP